MSELEYLESKIRENQEECVQLRQKERFQKHAKECKLLYDAYVDAGFTEEQAWFLFGSIFQKSLENC